MERSTPYEGIPTEDYPSQLVRNPPSITSRRRRGREPVIPVTFNAEPVATLATEAAAYLAVAAAVDEIFLED